MDIAIAYNSATMTFGIALEGADLTTESGLRTAVIVSLFTDRRARPDDVIPDGTDDRRGWWADAWPEVDGDRIGSRLWLLSREKQTANALQRAQGYSEEALAWLIEDGIAAAVTVTAEWVRDAQGGASAAGGRMPGAATGVLGLHVAIQLADGGRFDDVFDYPLEGQ